jgi:hypothetical protein
VRLRYSSGANRNAVYMKLDDFRVGDEIEKAPIDPISYRNNKTQTHLTWKNSAGSYSLGYSQSEPAMTIGNEGLLFLAVNQFDDTDLAPYKNKYISSVSAYLFGCNPNPALTQTAIKVIVYQDDTVRLVRQTVESFEPFAWNTFKLDAPILITNQKNLKIGIELFQHDADAMPLAFDNAKNFNRKGNIYSEDFGETWLYAADVDMFGQWCITANVRDNSNDDVEEERTQNVMGYEIYRNGVKIIPELYYNQHYIDDSANNAAVCYTIKAFGLGGMSDASAQVCVEVFTANQPSFGVEQINIYPNPADDFINIDKPFQKIEIIDINGKIVVLSSNQNIDISTLKKGIYFAKITDNANQTQVIKFIKK